ncbi:cytochrome P460 family protein [Algibacillus agarilyticus]|uniref:cytochrome P460 family protein n=1 Tax=Algibacillus agarilyticus TaxID=2234133 RepID=UPI000DCFE3BB|nr:cytochrome P460 family protein [Algibacillus agarilyticus]
MNKLQLCILGIVCSFSSYANDKPYQKSEFKIPKLYKPDISHYPQNWKRLSGYEYSALHWKQFVVIYTNGSKAAYAANHLEFMRIFEEDLDPEEDEINYHTYPVGTILLKESFENVNSRPERSLFLSGMIKREIGYDPEFGDWEYFQSTPEGQIISKGNSQDAAVNATCISCHQNIPEKDFVFASHYSVKSD